MLPLLAPVAAQLRERSQTTLGRNGQLLQSSAAAAAAATAARQQHPQQDEHVLTTLPRAEGLSLPRYLLLCAVMIP
jgi:hypothetical protein